MDLVRMLLVLVTLVLQVWGTSAGDDVSCPSGMVYKQCGPGQHCIKSFHNLPLNLLHWSGTCVPGCYCKNAEPYETWTLDGVSKCVDSLSKCICPDGQVYQRCPCKRTCDCMSPICGKCRPGCGCPSNAPIWHNGKCIKAKECICPNKCVTQGCDGCNRCKCKNGKVKGCTDRDCPDITTVEGFSELLAKGCWRLCPSGRRCIFYSPCPDSFKPSCKSFPGGYCKECNQCTCNKAGDPTCSVNIQPCSDALFQSVKLGCYRLVKRICTYVNPCPEHPSEKNCCQCSKAGQMSCKDCNECECVNALKVCNKAECPDPTSNGCYVSRRYPGFPKGCFYVSPCPGNVPGPGICTTVPTAEYCKTCALCKCDSLFSCPTPRCPDPKLNSCYLYNDKLGHCELVSPCPQSCCEGEMTCRDCNECVCQDGNTKCASKKCGNPIVKGCWLMNSFTNSCEFKFPCPHDAVLNSLKFCALNPGQRFCQVDDCNVCTCSNTASGPIACTEIGCIQPRGCWRPTDGYCKFFFPCPN